MQGYVVIQNRIRPLQHLGENIFIAYGPDGTYEVIVTVDGYLEWRAVGVEVRATRCDVLTTSMGAELSRAQ